MELRGIGIGQGVAVGRVIRMSDPLPEPEDVPSTLTPEAEGGRANAAMAVVASDLMSRGERAGGAARDVLEAQAMMASSRDAGDDGRVAVGRAMDGRRRRAKKDLPACPCCLHHHGRG